MKNFRTTPDMDAFIRQHYLLPAPELTAKFNQQFGTNRTKKQIHGMRKARGLSTGRSGRFYKGQPRIPNSGAKKATSTSFKKGHKPSNIKPVGSQRIDKDGYTQIKIENPNKWAFKHRIVWEKVHGKVPEGHTLWFIDQDRQNCSLNNLELISRSEQVRRNKMSLSKQPKQLRDTIKLIAKLQDQQHRIMK